MKKRVMSYLMIVCILCLTACNSDRHVKKREAPQKEVLKVISDEASRNDFMKFYVELFKKSVECDNEENVLISPLSVAYALGMTANGASAETLKEIENVLGMNVDQINQYLLYYSENLSEDEYSKLCTANSIWMRNDKSLQVEKTFINTNKEYYDAEIFKEPFDDKTCKKINQWVSKKTDKMIPEILDEISEDVVMYLINALSFAGKWNEPYKENQIVQGTFTTVGKEQKEVSYLLCTLKEYLEDEDTVGFLKRYKGKTYGFFALLPDEKKTINEYVGGLSADKLKNLLDNINTEYDVNTKLPKFETEYKVEMSGILSEMGMARSFNPMEADFSKLGHSESGNIFISRVLHNTYMKVDEKGTKAAASTAVEMKAEEAEEKKEIKEVFLDRPFVYGIVDIKTKMPIFIGAMKK